MNTQAKAQNVTISKSKNVSEEINHTHFWKKAEFNRFGIIPVLLLVVGCMGGFAASYGAGESTVRLAMVAFPSIVSLALMLAVAPMRLIIWMSSVAVMLDLMVLIF